MAPDLQKGGRKLGEGGGEGRPRDGLHLTRSQANGSAEDYTEVEVGTAEQLQRATSWSGAGSVVAHRVYVMTIGAELQMDWGLEAGRRGRRDDDCS